MQHKNGWSSENNLHIQNSLRKQLLSKKVVLAAILIAAVGAAVVAVHWPALSARALSYDDAQYLTKNVLVQNPSWTSTKRFLTEILEPSTVKGYYQPLAMISLMLDYALGGRENNLMPFHRTSLILHTANTALIIVLLYLLFGQIWVAAGVGLLFGLHPMTVEPIPWVGERKTLLAAFFSLWSLILYVYPRVTGHESWHGLPAREDTARMAVPPTGFYISSLVAYLLALMSKPTSTPLPLVMLLMDYWPLRRLNWQAVLEKVLFFVFGGISAVITVISQSRTCGAAMPGRFGSEYIPLVLCHNIIFYLFKIIWPVNLSSYYPFPELLNLSQPMVLAGVLGTCVLFFLLTLSLRWTRAALTGWLIFLVAILPTMQIIGFSDVIASDKFAYLPSIGLLMILASFLVWLCNIRFLMFCRLSVVIILVLACTGAVATRRYLAYWQDTEPLVRYMLKLTPDAAPLHNMLGLALQSQGRFGEAMDHYRRAIQIEPDSAEAYNNIGSIFHLEKNFGQAVEYYLQAIKYEPDSFETYNNLGAVLQSQGKLDEAISRFRQALNIRPDFADAHISLALALRSQGKLDEAASHYQQVLRIKPDYIEAYDNLAAVFVQQNRLSEAIECCQQALRRKPDSAGTYCNLGIILGKYGRLNDAANQFRRALQLKPHYADAFYNLGKVFQLQGSLDEAASCYRQAINLDPNSARAHNNLGAVLLAQGKLDEAVDRYRRVLGIEPNDARAVYNLGFALLQQGRFDEAAGCFRQALLINPDFVEAKHNLEIALKSKQKSSP